MGLEKMPQNREGRVELEDCQNCHGVGWFKTKNGDEKCQRCNGTGKVKKRPK